MNGLEIQEHLQWEANARRLLLKKPDPSIVSIPEFVLNHGRVQTGTMDLPKGILRGPLKYCFINALGIVSRYPKKYVYCEGFAYLLCLPVHHAWVAPIDDLDRAMEVTWREVGSGYVGVPFDFTYVRKVANRQGGFCILDRWEEGFPLLTGKDAIEEALLKVPR